jgi:ribosomal protein L39E
MLRLMGILLKNKQNIELVPDWVRMRLNGGIDNHVESRHALSAFLRSSGLADCAENVIVRGDEI